MIIMASNQSLSSLTTDASLVSSTSLNTNSTPSDLSLISCLQEKCFHLNLMIRQLNKNFKSNKIRNDSIELLSKTLNNFREENVMLREKTQRYQKTIIGLIYKIQQGQQFHLEPNEKAMLLSLVGIQNTDVIEQLKNAGSTEVQRLRKELSESQDKLINAEKIITAIQSNNIISAADIEINSSNTEVKRLQARIQEMAEDYGVQEHLFLCKKEEANDLHAKLKDQVLNCKLEQEKRLKLGENQMVVFPQQECSESLINNLTQEMENLKEENRKLKNNYEEVLAMNSRWQKYNRDRDEYVRNLLSTIQNLQDSITHSLNHADNTNLELLYKTEQRKREEIQRELIELQRKYQEAGEQFQAARLQLMSYEGSENCFRNCGGSRPTASQKEDLERIQMLEHQVKAFTEDWQAERADRENALAKISDLESENRLLQEQLREFDMNDRRHYRSTFSCNLPGQTNCRLISRGQDRRSPTQYYIFNNVESDAATPNPKENDKVSIEESNKGAEKLKRTLLPCPRCNKEFRQSDLLDHFEFCE